GQVAVNVDVVGSVVSSNRCGDARNTRSTVSRPSPSAAALADIGTPATSTQLELSGTRVTRSPSCNSRWAPSISTPVMLEWLATPSARVNEPRTATDGDPAQPDRAEAVGCCNAEVRSATAASALGSGVRGGSKAG